ncbi:T9SS type A sorting domain-containing protein [Flavobacteriaceae bacterium Ap0902]|nr:T9SS type A sorting domain-containing protein [Flavobacteriaceae bacterium Ap0902]
MKKIFTTLLLSALVLGQINAQTFSFEASEGFTLGDINGQQGWISTPATDTNLEGQEITDTRASHGDRSLMITADTRFGVQEGPVAGAFYDMAEPTDATDGFIQFDFYYDSVNSGNYALDLVNLDELLLVSRTLITESGNLAIVKEENGQLFIVETVKVTAGSWHTIRLEFMSTGINTSLDGELVDVAALVSDVPYTQLRFVHDNNPNAVAYFDNVGINEVLATEEVVLTEKVQLYPNPVHDVLNIVSGSEVKSVEVYTFLGQKMNLKNANSKLDFSSLPSGVYIVKVETENGVTSHKVVKK